MDWKNIKTTLSGYVTFLLALPAFVQAIMAYANHQPVDWRFVSVSCALAVVGYGLNAAKDKTNVSTLPQVMVATQLAEAAATPETKAKDEQQVGKAAIDEVKKL